MNAQNISLQAAVTVLEELASGRLPQRGAVLPAALALDTLCRQLPSASRDLLDAAAGLEILATGGTLDLDVQGRQRAAYLANTVRAAIDA